MTKPAKLNLLGIGLIIIGLALMVLYFKGQKPAIMQVPVFAVLSAYAETRSFQWIETNATDEIGFLLLTTGLALLVFNTFREDTREKRLAAFEFALKYSLILAVIAYVLVFGYAIFGVLMALFPLFVVLYLVKFELLKKAPN